MLLCGYMTTTHLNSVIYLFIYLLCFGVKVPSLLNSKSALVFLFFQNELVFI